MGDSSKAITTVMFCIVIPFMVAFYVAQVMFKLLIWMLEGIMYFGIGCLAGTARGIKKWKV